MKDETCLLGTPLIYVGSCLMTLNFVGWLCFGIPLRLLWLWIMIWVFGIIAGVIELSCQGRSQRKL